MSAIKNRLFENIYWQLKHFLLGKGLEGMFNLHCKYGKDELRLQLDSFYMKNEREFMETLDSFSIKVIQRYPREFQEQVVDQLTEIGMLTHCGLVKDALFAREANNANS
jgi:hypothetical protein